MIWMVTVMSSSFFLIFETAVLIIIAVVSLLVSKIMSEQQPVDQTKVYPVSYWIDMIARQVIFISLNIGMLLMMNGILSGVKDHLVQSMGHVTECIAVLMCLAGVLITPILQQAVRAENWLNEHEPVDTGKHAKQQTKHKSNVGQTQHHQAIKPTAGLIVKSVAELLTLTNHDADSIQNRSKN